MEDYEKKILDAIYKDVQAESQLVLEELNSEVEKMHNEQLSIFKKSLEKETEHYCEKEINDLRIAAANKKSQVKFDYMQQLLNIRLQYIKEILNEVEKELQEFVKSAKYEQYLSENLKQTPVKESGYFVVRKEDVKLMQSLLDEKGWHNKIQVAYFQFGGYCYIDEKQGLEYSCDLKEKLEDSLEWFKSHSGFILEGKE